MRTSIMSLAKEIVFSSKAANPVGPYNQAVKAGGLLFVSGQLGLCAKTGEFSSATCVVKQTETALENVKAIVEAAGLEMKDIVKPTVLMKNIGDYPKINEVYARYFTTGQD
eukprot:GHVL01036995.1.p1 GENE.GHVL01036995.1~~GHVL01036995.1.p1  ORF type:complete len:111 (+),score=13.29 GHVL01036995.1:23-355(+)